MHVRRLSQWLHCDLLRERRRLDEHEPQLKGVCSRALDLWAAAHRTVSLPTQQAADLIALVPRALTHSPSAPQEPSPLPPSPPTAGGNWLREMELMQRHSQYIVTKPETKSSKDKEKEKEKSDELNRSTSLRRKGTWTRLLRAQNANPPEGSF
ncbi:hypothetical protein BDZ89DRAFT_1138536 [Hymenopellis radicata]|nr:hypothetical protein BDZ89DRAFT_1138536 [Hymenopellis radicata]